MEARIAQIEADVSHIKSNLATMQLDVRDLRSGLAATNDAIADVRIAITALDGKVNANARITDGKSAALAANADATIATLYPKVNANSYASDTKIATLSAKTDTNGEATDAKIALSAKITVLSDKIDTKFGTMKWLLVLLLTLSIATPIAEALHWL